MSKRRYARESLNEEREIVKPESSHRYCTYTPRHLQWAVVPRMLQRLDAYLTKKVFLWGARAGGHCSSLGRVRRSSHPRRTAHRRCACWCTPHRSRRFAGANRRCVNAIVVTIVVVVDVVGVVAGCTLFRCIVQSQLLLNCHQWIARD
jgi:hypothetical protein